MLVKFRRLHQLNYGQISFRVNKRMLLILIYNCRSFKRNYFKNEWDSKHVKYDKLKEDTTEVV